jgi:putative ABC transport system permease protein
VLKNARGRPIASAEVVVVVGLPTKSRDLEANVVLRGVGEEVWALRPNVRLIAGRHFEPGLHELIAGKGVRDEFMGVALGSTLSLGGQPWTVVGIFDSGDSHSSEMWADAGVVGSAYRRGSSITSLTVRVTDPHAFEPLEAALATDPRLKVDLQTTRQYYGQQSGSLPGQIRVLGTIVGVIMALGAIFGALNTMYAAVASRTREIATLRAIGFRGVPVIVSVLLETMLLAMLGGVVGAALAWSIFDGYTAATLGANFSEIVFAFNVSPGILLTGLKWALALGFIGGLFPAVRAARMPVAVGLREL